MTTKHTKDTKMWIVIKRNYHGIERKLNIRWVVVREGELRGVCECWDPADAERIASALNGFQGLEK